MEARIRAEILTPSYHHFTEEEDAETHRIILSRVFSNVTGDVVEVNEIGILLHAYADLWYKVVTGHHTTHTYLYSNLGQNTNPSPSQSHYTRLYRSSDP